jgi:hypothetical protein
VNDRPGDWSLLAIPLTICGLMLVLAATFVAPASSAPTDRERIACIQAAPVERDCRP